VSRWTPFSGGKMGQNQRENFLTESLIDILSNLNTPYGVDIVVAFNLLKNYVSFLSGEELIHHLATDLRIRELIHVDNELNLKSLHQSDVEKDHFKNFMFFHINNILVNNRYLNIKEIQNLLRLEGIDITLNKLNELFDAEETFKVYFEKNDQDKHSTKLSTLNEKEFWKNIYQI
jgi:hypothetical protein